MKTMTALEAKNSFGKLLDASQREPVMVTKQSRPVAALLSIHDIEELASAYLPASLEGDVRSEGDLVEALMRQARIDNRIAAGRREIAEGKGITMDAAYFDRLRARVTASARR
jgi:prevent-host-death family protein